MQSEATTLSPRPSRHIAIHRYENTFDIKPLSSSPWPSCFSVVVLLFDIFTLDLPPPLRFHRSTQKIMKTREFPSRGEKWTEIMSDVESVVMPGINHWQHPRYDRSAVHSVEAATRTIPLQASVEHPAAGGIIVDYLRGLKRQPVWFLEADCK